MEREAAEILAAGHTSVVYDVTPDDQQFLMGRLRSVSSVTGRKSVTCAGRPQLPSNTTIESGTRDRTIIGCSSHSTVQPELETVAGTMGHSV